VTPAGGLTSLQRVMIEAVTESMTGFVVPVAVLPRLGPDEFARMLSNRDELFRSYMLRFMLLCALVLNPLPEEVVDRVDVYARELSVDNDMLRVAHRFARHSFGLALVDFQRSGYMETWFSSRSPVLHTSHDLDDAWQEVVRDEQLAKRWKSLRDLPDGALGREVAKFYDAPFVFRIRWALTVIEAGRRFLVSPEGATDGGTARNRPTKLPRGSFRWRAARPEGSVCPALRSSLKRASM
jgi:hypothetical protein